MALVHHFFLVCGFALLGSASVCKADVWAYVDDKGVAHFATSRLDDRYQLFAKVDDPLEPASAVLPSPGLVPLTPALAASSAPQKRLLALFEKSPDYAVVNRHLRDASQRHGLAYELLAAIMAAESGFNRNAVSPKGAIGLMQLMPATAERFGVKPVASQPVAKRLLDPAVNIDAGARYLRYLFNLFSNDLSLVLAAYNAGEGAVQRAGGKIPNFPETQQYVKTVVQLHQLLQGTLPAKEAAVRAVAPVKPSMMVPGMVAGRSNMVQGMSSRSGQITLMIPSQPASDAVTQ